ncbi:helix-turn-helix transcriptional regulator [Streptomyces sp. NPDC005963]|uniref:helix-turn-helix domain-containing protein n=1 Tax=Streptomyces sp. NPDC005963 TaxID=3156721 RepID=UPI0033EE04B3
MLRSRMRERGLSQGQVAVMIRCHPSRVSRALSASSIPPRHLIEAIAMRLDVEVPMVMRMWADADAIRREGRACREDGGPPDGLASYSDLIRALSGLIDSAGLSQRELTRRDRSGILRRSTLGAVLRGERSARRDVVLAIVRTCGAGLAAVAAWDAAWEALGRPHREARLQRSAEIYSRIKRADRRSDLAYERRALHRATWPW